MYCDVEPLLVAWLGQRFPDAKVVTELPGDISTGLFIEVTRIGGIDSDWIDHPRVDIDCYAPPPVRGQTGRPEARRFALQVQKAILHALPGYIGTDGTVLEASTAAGVAWRPYANTSVRRFGFTVDLGVKPLARF